MCANLGDSRSRDCELRPQKIWKKLRFLAEINSPLTQKPFDVQSWNLNTMWVLMNVLCKPSFKAPSHVTKILQAKNGRKVEEFEPIYLGNYQYWWKMVCDFWAHYQPLFFWLCSFTPTWISFCWFCIFFLTVLFFLSFLPLSTFKLLNALYSKFERLNISRRTFVQQKLGCQVGESSSTESSKILNF